MAHPAARRCGLPGDKSDDRFCHMLSVELRSLFLRRASNLTDENDGFCSRVLFEHGQKIHKIEADDRIATDAHAR